MYWNFEPVTLDEILAQGRTIRPNYGERSPEYNVQFPWEKKAFSDPDDIKWNVFYHDSNSGKIDTYNIFDHSSFHLYVKKAAKKCQTKDEFAKNLRSELMYYFWSKCEWEVLISPWISSRENEEMKIDVCWQVMNNWDVFLDYVWNNKRKL